MTGPSKNPKKNPSKSMTELREEYNLVKKEHNELKEENELLRIMNMNANSDVNKIDNEIQQTEEIVRNLLQQSNNLSLVMEEEKHAPTYIPKTGGYDKETIEVRI